MGENKSSITEIQIVYYKHDHIRILKTWNGLFCHLFNVHK